MSHPAAPYAPATAYHLPGPEAQVAWSEARLQQECIFWLQAYNPRAAQHLFAIPNGGLRTAREAAALKAQGVKAGVPDLLLAQPAQRPALLLEPWSAQSWHGLFIELKTATGTVAPAQHLWHERLRAQGYQVAVVRSLPGFIELLTAYLA